MTDQDKFIQQKDNLSTKALIKVDDVCFKAGDKNILQNISFEMQKGEIVTLIGPNGSGKTTLIKIILKLLEASSGSILLSEAIKIGYVPQKIAIDRTFPLSVRRFLKLFGSDGNLRDTKDIEDVAQRVGISSIMKNQVHDISGGQFQKIMFARALLLNPDLLVLDEPAQGFDANGQAEFYKLLNDIRKERGCGILMVSHDLHLVMAATDRVICLNHHICCQGRPEDVSNNPDYISLFGRSFEKNIAFYTHKHDHEHDADGCVVEEKRDKTES